ncbi:MAG: acyl-CoA dehydrogenase family protein [Burkholderiales bacterium]|nr:acyl-CoA dehydrogenase family protein [Burkholderiales bacterium]
MASAVPDARGANLYHADPALAATLKLCIPADLFAVVDPHLQRLGALAGSSLDDLAATADKNPPRLHHRDRTGVDRQWIEKHPAYEEMERLAFGEFGLSAMSHRPGVFGWPKPLPPAVKYAISYLFVQAEFGLLCPVSMTDALARTLAKFGSPDLVGRYLPGLTATDMDQHLQGAMFMTEQGAGSDVGATATVAERAGDHWLLTGDKWFCSNADAEVALVLARPRDGIPGTKGLGLYLLPRTLSDGTPNRYRIVRLKDKLGTRSMASGEIKLEGAIAYLVGDEAKGFVQMADMINTSRLSNGMRAAGMMRRAFFEARHVARQRIAFGRPVIDMPLARRQLMKILLAAECARAVMFAAARALEAADAGDEAARRRLRVLTPLLKFRACRDARRATGDAMEMRGGAGYIEEWSDARLLRDAHLGSIWEGTSNIVAGDVMRAIRKEHALEALDAELDRLDREAGADEERFGLRERAQGFAADVARQDDAEHARQAASGLYYSTAATLLAWEGKRIGGALGAQRAALSRLVMRNKLDARDPLAPDSSAQEAEALLA